MIPTFTLPLFAMGRAKLLVEFTDYLRVREYPSKIRGCTPTYQSGKRNTDYSETAGLPVETLSVAQADGQIASGVLPQF